MPLRTSHPGPSLTLVRSGLDEAVSEEAVSEEAVSEEAVSEEAVSEEAVSEEARSNRSTADKEISGKAVSSGDTASGVGQAENASASSSRAREDSAWSDQEDGKLVALARAGETRAFEELYRRHSAYALALAVRVQGNAHDVRDVLHDAFLRVHDRLEHLRSGDAFRPWLGSVVVSLVRSRLRRRRMLQVLGLVGSEPIELDALTSPQAGPEVRAQLAQVYATLRTVSVEQRICWTLRYVEGRKLEEVAKLSECSLATAKRRIAAVQEKLAASTLEPSSTPESSSSRSAATQEES